MHVPTEAELWARYLILGLSWLGAGVALSMAVGNLRVAWGEHDGWRPFYIGAATVLVGVALIEAVVSERVARAPFIPSETVTWLYTVGLGLVLSGLLLILWHYRRRRRAGDRVPIGPDRRRHDG